METIVPHAFADRLKRYWRRRRYQRHNADQSKKKLKIVRLGRGGPDQGGNRTRMWKLRTKTRKLKWKLVSPIKMLTKLHDAYVDMMMRFAANFGKNRLLGDNKQVAKDEHLVSMASYNGEKIDAKLVFEIYKSLATSRQSTVLF